MQANTADLLMILDGTSQAPDNMPILDKEAVSALHCVHVYNQAWSTQTAAEGM